MEQFDPGKVISFRLPKDTPPHISDYLTDRKETLGRKFASENAALFIKVISQEMLKPSHHEDNRLTITLPEGLTNKQKEWFQDPNTKALVGQMLYQIVKDPLRAVDVHVPLTKELSHDDEIEKKGVFKTNKAISNFAKNTFLNLDDDDD